MRSEIPGHTLLETSTSQLHEREEDLQAAADKIGGHLFEVRLRLLVQAPPSNKSQANERLQGMAASLGAFTKSRLARFRAGPIRKDALRHGTAFLLSQEELATLWHPPTSTAAAEKMPSSDFTELEGPAKFHSEEGEGSVTLGRVRFRDDRRLVSVGLEDRRRHLYICGKTGIGKTTLLQNMIAMDMREGRSCRIDHRPRPQLAYK
jgi:hypothetical protein